MQTVRTRSLVQATPAGSAVRTTCNRPRRAIVTLGLPVVSCPLCRVFGGATFRTRSTFDFSVLALRPPAGTRRGDLVIKGRENWRLSAFGDDRPTLDAGVIFRLPGCNLVIQRCLVIHNWDGCYRLARWRTGRRRHVETTHPNRDCAATAQSPAPGCSRQPPALRSPPGSEFGPSSARRRRTRS